MSLRPPMTSLAPAHRRHSPVARRRACPRVVEFYLASIRLAIADHSNTASRNYFYMIVMVAEPIIYLVVWSTIARQQDGEVGGFTPGEFAATTSSGRSSEHEHPLYPVRLGSGTARASCRGCSSGPSTPIHFDSATSPAGSSS